jgi:hypothetical protein
MHFNFVRFRFDRRHLYFQWFFGDGTTENPVVAGLSENGGGGGRHRAHDSSRRAKAKQVENVHPPPLAVYCIIGPAACGLISLMQVKYNWALQLQSMQRGGGGSIWWADGHGSNIAKTWIFLDRKWHDEGVFLPRNAETDTHVVFQSSIDLSRPNGNEQESEWLMTRNVGTW